MNKMKKSCGDCKTTKTPLWRSGPFGHRSLCNACGIRYRKRKMADDKEPSSELMVESESSDYVNVNQINEPFKMRYSCSDMGYKEQGSMSSSSFSSSSFKLKKQRSSNSEESISSKRNLGEVQQAAVLLMSLSCGSVFV